MSRHSVLSSVYLGVSDESRNEIRLRGIVVDSFRKAATIAVLAEAFPRKITDSIEAGDTRVMFITVASHCVAGAKPSTWKSVVSLTPWPKDVGALVTAFDG